MPLPSHAVVPVHVPFGVFGEMSPAHARPSAVNSHAPQITLEHLRAEHVAFEHSQLPSVHSPAFVQTTPAPSVATQRLPLSQ